MCEKVSKHTLREVEKKLLDQQLNHKVNLDMN
jgi:hypothetical protein